MDFIVIYYILTIKNNYFLNKNKFHCNILKSDNEIARFSVFFNKLIIKLNKYDIFIAMTEFNNN